MISTYTELVSKVQDWLNRDDLNGIVPDFILLAEAEFNRVLRTSQQLRKINTSTSDGFVALSPSILELVRVKSNTGPLTLANPEQVAERPEDIGTPREFSLYGNTLELFPKPKDTVPLEILFYAKVTNLSDENPSNWLLENHPDVYLYNALVHSAPYLKEDTRLPVWESKAAQTLGSLVSSDDTRTTSGSVPKQKSRTF